MFRKKRTSIQFWKMISVWCLLLSLILTGCGASNQRQKLDQSEVEVTFAVEPNPPGIGPGQLTMQLTTGEGQPIEEATVEVVGAMAEENMTMRMQARAEADGTYRTPFVWPVSGDWVMTVRATVADEPIAERRFEVAVAEKVSLNVGGDGHEWGEHNHPDRFPNEGAAIRITAPPDGAVFEAGRDIDLEIETDNFDLGQTGNHWHVYVDHQPGQMIMGRITDAVLRNLEPGQHRISTYLSIGGHDELEEGATVTITVLEPDEGE